MWLVLATFASVTWGLCYVLYEQVFKQISVPGTIAIVTFAASLLVGVFAYVFGDLKSDMTTILNSWRLFGLVFASVLALALAELLIGFSIIGKNASLAAFIEISYPFFAVLFAFLLFREQQMTLMTSLGGLLIFIGAFVVYWFAD